MKKLHWEERGTGWDACRSDSWRIYANRSGHNVKEKTTIITTHKKNKNKITQTKQTYRFWHISGAVVVFWMCASELFRVVMTSLHESHTLDFDIESKYNDNIWLCKHSSLFIWLFWRDATNRISGRTETWRIIIQLEKASRGKDTSIYF